MIYAIVITFLIFVSYYLLFIRAGVRFFHQKIIMAVFFTSAQIIITQLCLGFAGLLYLNGLIFVNVLLIIAVIFAGRRAAKDKIAACLKEELNSIYNGVLNAMNPANAMLLALAGFLLIWTGVCAYFLPPRGFDSLSYHLPRIYEHIINHKIFPLPVEFYKHFALPQNAEFLFMWPVIFFRSQQWVDFVPVIAAFWGVAVIYGLARFLDIRPKDALFVSLLYLFCPVVLENIGLNYIDIIISVFFLTGIYCAIMFSKTGYSFYFYSAALAWGLLCGMKYNMVFLVLAIAPFSFKDRWRMPLRQWALFAGIFLGMGSFWYIINFLALQNPFYPMDFSHGSLGFFKLEQGSFNLKQLLLDIPKKFLSILQKKSGFGLEFWAIAFPAWIYVCFRRFTWWIFVPVIFGIAQLMAIPLIQAQINPYCRYSLFILAFGLLSLGKVFTIYYEQKFFKKWLMAACITYSVMAAAVSVKETNFYQLKMAVNDFKAGKYLTEQIYTHRATNVAYGILDYLTLNDPAGLSCYVVGKKGFKLRYIALISPLYGTYLQNRVWNLQKNNAKLPDAILFMRNRHNDDFRFPTKKVIPYAGLFMRNLSKFVPQLDRLKINEFEYALILEDRYNLLFLRKDFLLKPGKQQRLQQILNKIKPNSSN